MAAMTSRIVASRLRQCHVSHIPSSSQLIVHSSQIQQPLSVAWALSQQQQGLPQNIWQQQRYQSDSLKQRAIDALKSKKNANDTSDSPTHTSGDAIQRNRSKGGHGRSRNVVSTGNNKNDEYSPAVAAASEDTASASVKQVDQIPEQPPIAPVPASTPTTDATAANVQEKTDGDQNDPDTDALNDANAGDSNPFAHMHLHEFAPKIVVVGVGGAGTNAVNNMVASGLAGEDLE